MITVIYHKGNINNGFYVDGDTGWVPRPGSSIYIVDEMFIVCDLQQCLIQEEVSTLNYKTRAIIYVRVVEEVVKAQ